MRLLIEGPKFAGKSSLVGELMKYLPTATCLHMRCFFSQSRATSPLNSYYAPREDVPVTLRSFNRGFQTFPHDDLIVERFHLFYWVHCVASGADPDETWAKLRSIDSRLAEAGFQVIVLLPEWTVLSRRRQAATDEKLRIPLKVLREHWKLYHAVAVRSRLPIKVVGGTDEAINCVFAPGGG